jgi:hypothetical protein
MAITYTSSLPPELFGTLNEYAQKLKVPKNQLIEVALDRYFHELKRQEYIASFKNAAQDAEQKELADSGLDDYLNMLDKV